MPDFDIEIEDKTRELSRLHEISTQLPSQYFRKLKQMVLSGQRDTFTFSYTSNNDEDLKNYVEEACKAIAEVYDTIADLGYVYNLYPSVEYTLPVKNNSDAFEKECPVFIKVEDRKSDALPRRLFLSKVKQVKPIAVKYRVEMGLRYAPIRRMIENLANEAFEKDILYAAYNWGEAAYITYFKWSDAFFYVKGAYMDYIDRYFQMMDEDGVQYRVWVLSDDEIEEIDEDWEFEWEVRSDKINENEYMIIISGSVERPEKDDVIPQFYDTLITDNPNVRTLSVGTDITIEELLELKSFNIERRLIYDDYTANVMDVGCGGDGKSNIEYPVRTGPSKRAIFCMKDVMKWIEAKGWDEVTDPGTNQPLKKIHIMNEIDIQEQEWEDIKSAKQKLEADEKKIETKIKNLRANEKIPYKMADNLMDKFRSQIREIQRKRRSLPSTRRQLDTAKIARNDVKRLQLKF